MKTKNLLMISALLCLPASAFAFGKKAPDQQPPVATNPADPAGMKVLVDSIASEEMILRLSYRDHALKNLVPNSEMDGLEAAWFGAITHFLTENPAIFGGSFDRGFEPKIWNAMVKVFRDRSIPMTTDGILLPPRAGLELRVYGGEKTPSGAIQGARLFLVDKHGQLVGPSLRPLTQTGIQTLDGDVIGVGNITEEFFRSAGISLEMMRNNSVEIRNVAVQTTAEIAGNDPITYTWGQCLALAADNKFSEASACFSAAGNATLASAASLGSDLAITGLRGALGGAVVGSAFPGIGASAGAAYAALANMLSVVYNAFLRKENISPAQINALMDVMANFTFSPTYYGEVQPKVGLWGITKAGYIRRVTKDLATGKFELLDVQGNPVVGQQAYVLNGQKFTTAPAAGTAAPAPAPQPGKPATVSASGVRQAPQQY